MRSRLLLLTALSFITALLAFRLKEMTTVTHTKAAYKRSVTKNIIRCSPDWSELNEWLEETDIPPIPGAGSYKWKITTSNDSAQFYFNQGINMYYSFHIIESMASFKKAAKFDPACAMLYWAQALAYGPNINDLGYAASPEALLATQKAIEFSTNATNVEKGLIDAMSVRYTADSADATRAKLNIEYTSKMRELYNKFPTTPDVQALYADAMMLEHPWDLWKNDGTPKPWTPLIETVLEKLLSKTPNHPGANHYYIHVMEPSPFAYKAIPSADRLGKLTPGLSHTVHMPSHIYLRTGNYNKGVTVNETALSDYEKVTSLYAPVIGAHFLYSIHNEHMKTNNAMLAGRAAYSSKAAEATKNSIPTEYLGTPGAMGNVIQYIYMTPVLVDIRFGNWDKLLTMKQPDPSMTYANILYHFGRGMALAQNNKLDEANNELKQVQELMKDSVLFIPFTPFSAAIDGAIIAENLLTGTIAVKEKRYDDAIAAFIMAVLTEDNMVYDEPRDWLLNPKHYLANAYIKEGSYTDAIKTLEKDLKNNKENGWALFGIWQALTAQKKTAEANKVLLRFRKAFDKSDVKLYGAVF